MMDDISRKIRVLSLSEVETLIDWAAAEGWNPGLHDAYGFYAGDPEGFIGAFVDGEMVSAISAVAYGEDFGFIGLYICHPQHRGKGHGKAVWDAAIARLKGRVIGLDGVDEQLQNYAGKGFAPSYRTIRFGGRPEVKGNAARRAHDVAGATAVVILYDRNCFPADRSAFLNRWLAPPHTAILVMDDSGIDGYAVLRDCREGAKIGGLFASSEASAIALFQKLASSRDTVIYIDVPAFQSGFIEYLVTLGMTPGFETTRMYRGLAPPVCRKMFGVTTLELG